MQTSSEWREAMQLNGKPEQLLFRTSGYPRSGMPLNRLCQHLRLIQSDFPSCLLAKASLFI